MKANDERSLHVASASATVMGGVSSTLTARVRRMVRRSWLALSMVVAIGVVLAIAIWSAARERADSIADFSGRQALLATAVSGDFEQRLAIHARGAASRETPPLTDDVVLELLAGAKKVEVPDDLMILVARPNASGFLTTDKRIIPSNRLRAALDAGDRSIFFSRDEAAAFGLPRRTAVAGLARAHTVNNADAKKKDDDWGIVVLASAQRLRDRQILDERRLALTVLVVTLVVAAFGFIARRRQYRELDLERTIAIAALEREREAALAKADKMAALAALSTGIAHEVGTPLGVIVGRVEQVIERLARASDDDDDAHNKDDPSVSASAFEAASDSNRSRAALGIVLEQVERIRRIVRGCLALARGDAPHLVRTPPQSLADRAIDLVRHRFDNAGVELTSHVDNELPTIACEPSLFEQALVNVLLNACEATPRGGCVRLDVRAVDREVRFVVDDDGIGIPDDVAKRAAEPFFSTRLDRGGSGLGLTIANEIVNHHSGALSVERRDNGQGTRATISITA